MSNMKQLTHHVFSKYVSAIKEYFDVVNKSDAIKNLVNAKSTL